MEQLESEFYATVEFQILVMVVSIILTYPFTI